MNLGRYYEMLNAAHSTSEEVDMFDLDSSNPESVERFKVLQADDQEAQADLIRYVMAEGDDLARQLANDEPDRLSPIDAFHHHEVLHGTVMVQTLFDQHIDQHRYTQSEPELKAAAEAIGEALADFYQLVGRKTIIEDAEGLADE